MAALRLYQYEEYILTGELGTYPRYENHYGNDNPSKKRRYPLSALKLSLKFVYRRARRRKELVGLAFDSGLEADFFSAICGSWFELIPEDETYQQVVELDGTENGPYPHAPDAKSEKESMGEMEATHKRDNQHSDVYAESDDLRLLKNARLQPIQWIDIPLEQTRIPTEQFFQLALLAAKTYRGSVSASGEKSKLSETIRSLSYILHRLLERRNTWLRSQRPRKCVLGSKWRYLLVILLCELMNNVLRRYNALGNSIKVSRNLWRTVKLGNGELISVEELRRKLATDTETRSQIAPDVMP